ncbi:lysosomal Pro-X carboxypeptidase-like isoform X2 [Chenopodium quinoa]|uniref:lysosomal Pro-X carboxypeptidase-like isoform X2 n=1 Tax=Chenopodium quinoa TaxID=63459 RepID=UPI000B785385|nr:lysosomal Pro-X carboxypeptidase-like isoform X2 [Chenopodium quinoa]
MATFRPHFILLLLLLCIITFTQSTPLFLGKYAKKPNKLSSYKYKTQYFTQQLDHFSFQDSGNFSQRYLINADNWVGAQRKGPIFMYCGNEGDIEWFASNSGFIWEIAPRFGAMLLFPEHRYYGESMPYGSKEEAYKNSTTLSYLTAEQAIADYAVLLRELKQNLSAEGCPVVLFGGSYGGMLAAWMRLKYPHLTVGALASSAPILQFEDIVPPETFYNIVSNDFRRESINCFNTIKESWGELQSMGENTDGLNQLTKTFHLCGELKNTQDLSDWLSSAYSYLAMVDYPYPSDFLMPLPGHPIREACTEMVMPMSSDPEKSMFPIFNFNKTYEEERCIRSYGVKPRFRWITTEFGGHDFKTTWKNSGSNIIFSNGLLDPWSGGSVLQNVSESLVALVTEEGAHHLDLRASTPNDPDWLVQQRVSEIRLIKGWIDDYNQGKGSAFSM